MPRPPRAIYTSPVKARLSSLLTATDSVGTHIASKLQLFSTHEETLTDELCDMLYAWLTRGRRAVPSSMGRYTDSVFKTKVRFSLKQSTKRAEADFGYDLAIRLSSPQGVKFALIQSKVFDPTKRKLRCANKRGWKKLRRQLKLMRLYSQHFGDDLVCLAVYAPTGILRPADSGIGTWEQQLEPRYAAPSQSTLTSQYGVSIFHYDKLLGPNNDWLLPKRVHFKSQSFVPSPDTLTQLIVDMLLCRRGQWHNQRAFPDDRIGPDPEFLHGFLLSFDARRQIDISVTPRNSDDWEEFVADLEVAYEAG